MNDNKLFPYYYNIPFVLTLFLIASKLEGRLEWSWFQVLFVPMSIDIVLGVLVYIVLRLLGSRWHHRQDKPYGQRLHWDGKNKRMYGPFEKDDQ